MAEQSSYDDPSNPTPKEPVHYPIDPTRTALLIIDMQNDFLEQGAPGEVPHARALVPKLNEVVRACREAGVTVIWVRHTLLPDGSDAGRLADMHPHIRAGHMTVHGTHGVEVFPQLDRQPHEVLIEKPRYSAFYGTRLESLLRTKGVDTLIIAGTVTNVCCDSTIKDGFSRDYKLIVISDGVATRDWPDMGYGPVPAELAQRVVLTVAACSFGEVASSDQLVARLGELVQ